MLLESRRRVFLNTDDLAKNHKAACFRVCFYIFHLYQAIAETNLTSGLPNPKNRQNAAKFLRFSHRGSLNVLQLLLRSRHFGLTGCELVQLRQF